MRRDEQVIFDLLDYTPYCRIWDVDHPLQDER